MRKIITSLTFCAALCMMLFSLLGCVANGTDEIDLKSRTESKIEEQSVERPETTFSHNKEDAGESNVANLESERAERESLDKERLEREKKEKREALIKELYVDKLTCTEEARALVLNALSEAKYIELSPEYHDSIGVLIRDEIIDSVVGNDILSSAAKSALNSLAEKKSASEILADAIDGAKGGTSDYLKGLINGEIKEITGKGVDVFKVGDIIEGFKNINDSPVELANGLIARQRSDINIAVGVVNDDELDAAGVQYLAALMTGIESRQRAIKDATDVNGYTINVSGKLADLAEKMAIAEAQLFFLAFNPDEELPQQGDAVKLNLPDINIYNAYDVKAFRAGIKNSGAAGNIIGIFGGNIVGNIASWNSEGVNKEGSSRRLDYTKILEYRLSINLLDLSKARVNYIGSAGVDRESKEESAAYYRELCKYLFNLKLVYAYYGISLTENESAFLNSLEDKITEIREFLVNNDISEDIGYTQEEKLSAEKTVSNAYFKFEDWEMGTSHSGIYAHMGDINCNKAPMVKIYANRGVPVLLLESHSLNYYGRKGYDVKIYDHAGNLLYVSKCQGVLYALGGEVIGFEAASDNLQTEENALKLYSEATQTLEAINAGTLKQSYCRFWW